MTRYRCDYENKVMTIFVNSVDKGVEKWKLKGAEAPLYFFSPPQKF